MKKEKKKADWKSELRSIVWLLLAVLGIHSFIAKPFYIPSESMVPTLLTGDRLVVTKYAYGWSYISPTIPNPFAIVADLVFRQPQQSWLVSLPFTKGRVLGRQPERGDVVIVTPVGGRQDYIKRAIGLPGDRLAVRDGVVFLNGKAVPRVAVAPVRVPVDPNQPCDESEYPGARQRGADGRDVCVLPAFRETLPNGRSYVVTDTAPALGGRASPGDNFEELAIPEGHVFVMGDNRDHSADSRYPVEALGLGGPIPIENLGGRAEIITFSMDGSGSYLNPISWFGALRARAGQTLAPERDS